MRNSRPFDILQRVDGCTVIVQGIQVMINAVQHFGSQRSARLVKVMCLAFKLSKQCLTEDGCAETFQEVVEDIGALFGVGFGRKQVFGQQHFVDGGSDFGDGDEVIRVCEGLGLVGQIGVHRMSQLMCQRESVVKGIGIVQQDKGMHAVDAGRISTRSLALVFIDVNPVFIKCAVKQCGIFFAQRCKGFFDQLFAFFIGHRIIDIVDHRNIQVVHIQLIQTQHLFAQAEVTFHRRQTGMDCFGQRIIDTDRNVAGKEGSLTGGIEPTNPCKSIVHPDMAGVVGSKGIDGSVESTHHLFKRILADRLAAAFTVYPEVAVGQRRGFAVFVDDILKTDIDIPEH